jgi:hypothetical protein
MALQTTWNAGQKECSKFYRRKPSKPIIIERMVMTQCVGPIRQSHSNYVIKPDVKKKCFAEVQIVRNCCQRKTKRMEQRLVGHYKQLNKTTEDDINPMSDKRVLTKAAAENYMSQLIIAPAVFQVLIAQLITSQT